LNGAENEQEAMLNGAENEQKAMLSGAENGQKSVSNDAENKQEAVLNDTENEQKAVLNSAVAVVDATKCRMYIKNFGEFFIDQISQAETIILSRTDKISEQKLTECVELLRGYNQEAVIITTPWDRLDGRLILDTIEKTQDLGPTVKKMIKELQQEQGEHNQAHAHSHNGNDASSLGEQEHHGHSHAHSHSVHDTNSTGEHEHHAHSHNVHDADCTCGCHHHRDHHHAAEVFTGFGMETPIAYEREEIESILERLEDESLYGMVLRAKGMVASGNGNWLYFDYVPGERNVRSGRADVTGKICVIGAQLKEENLKTLWKKEGLFHV